MQEYLTKQQPNQQTARSLWLLTGNGKSLLQYSVHRNASRFCFRLFLCVADSLRIALASHLTLTRKAELAGLPNGRGNCHFSEFHFHFHYCAIFKHRTNLQKKTDEK